MSGKRPSRKTSKPKEEPLSAGEEILPRMPEGVFHSSVGLKVILPALPFYSDLRDGNDAILGRLYQKAVEVFRRHGKEHLLRPWPKADGTLVEAFVDFWEVDPAWPTEIADAARLMLAVCQAELEDASASHGFRQGLELGYLYARLELPPDGQESYRKGRRAKRADSQRAEAIREQGKKQRIFERFPLLKGTLKEKLQAVVDEFKVKPGTAKRYWYEYKAMGGDVTSSETR